MSEGEQCAVAAVTGLAIFSLVLLLCKWGIDREFRRECRRQDLQWARRERILDAQVRGMQGKPLSADADDWEKLIWRVSRDIARPRAPSPSGGAGHR